MSMHDIDKRMFDDAIMEAAEGLVNAKSVPPPGLSLGDKILLHAAGSQTRPPADARVVRHFIDRIL